MGVQLYDLCCSTKWCITTVDDKYSTVEYAEVKAVKATQAQKSPVWARAEVFLVWSCLGGRKD